MEFHIFVMVVFTFNAADTLSMKLPKHINQAFLSGESVSAISPKCFDFVLIFFLRFDSMSLVHLSFSLHMNSSVCLFVLFFFSWSIWFDCGVSVHFEWFYNYFHLLFVPLLIMRIINSVELCVKVFWSK